MTVFTDYEGQQIVLTDLVEQHITSGHYEIRDLGIREVIEGTLAHPDIVTSHNRALHYFRMRLNTQFGDKYIRVVVSEDAGTRHVRTAYITSRVGRGVVVWERGM
jgi:hypothetical protein